MREGSPKAQILAPKAFGDVLANALRTTRSTYKPINGDIHPNSTRRAAVKNRLCGDFVQGKLRLQVSATLIETRHNDEDDSSSKHQPGEKREVLVIREPVAAGQDPFVNQTDKQFAGSNSQQPQRHDRAFHRVRRLSVGKFKTGD